MDFHVKSTTKQTIRRARLLWAGAKALSALLAPVPVRHQREAMESDSGPRAALLTNSPPASHRDERYLLGEETSQGRLNGISGDWLR